MRVSYILYFTMRMFHGNVSFLLMTLFFPKHLRILSKIFLALAIFSIAGGEWTLFQAIAYGRMIYSYSSNASLQTALAKTFSGKHPCSLCKKISMERKKTAKHESFIEKNVKKWDLILPLITVLESPIYTSVSYPAFHYGDYAEPIIEVPKPPPNLRTALFVF